MKLRQASLALVVLSAAACESAGDKPGSAPALSQGAPAASKEPPVPVVPTPVKPTSFASQDRAALVGDIYVSVEPNAPAVVLVHRASGDRAELGPLVERLRVAPRRFSILSFDLRGHGGSKAPAQAKPNDTKPLAQDVVAAISHLEEAAKPRAFVLVGTSLGAALVSEVAFAQPKVTALALISPGASIAGHDLYKPYAEVRDLPTFVGAARDDTVSKDPADTLEKMAMNGTVKRYDGSRHSAAFLGEEHPELWSDLETWLLSVFDVAPKERRSLYFAPGKQPKPAGARGAQKKGK